MRARATDEDDGPVLSVIVPALDAEATLGAQLDALADQSSPVDWEVLVCDNGSRDGTARLVAERATAFPRLRLVDATVRPGPAAARNIGAKSARGSVLLFCDADDLVAPGWLQAMHRGLDAHELVAGTLEWDRLNAQNRGSVSWSEDGELILPFRPDLRAAPSNNLGIRRDLFERIGGFDESLRTAEDIDLCWRAQLAGAELRRVPDAVVHARKRTGLRAVYRQAYAYATGTAELRRRYGRIDAPATAVARPPASPVVPPHEARSAGVTTRLHAVSVRARRLLGRAVRVRHPGDLADVAWRLGQRRGFRDARRAAGVEA